MAEAVPTLVLDSFAVLAHFEGEAEGVAVRQLLEAAQDRTVNLAISLINVGEVYYITSREQGIERGEEILSDLRRLPIKSYEASEKRILDAARIKAKHSISYADAFAVGLAQELKATLVTGDPEFQKLQALTPLMWLSKEAG